MSPRTATSIAKEKRLATKREVADYLRDGGSQRHARVAIDAQHLDGATAELAALIAEARGHGVRPEPDVFRFGNWRSDNTSATGRQDGALRIGIVVNPRRRIQVSDRAALQGFIAAAERRGLRARLVARASVSPRDRFDAYLIREDTSPVGGAVYRFVYGLERAGCVSLDDFRSLIRCGNKAYQAVLFARLGIPIPRTLLWFRDDRIDAASLGYPVVVKRPDGAFSRDVHRCDTEPALHATAARLFRRSPVLVLQSFVESSFDWRVGVCDVTPIYAVKYHYPVGSWKIADYDRAGRSRFGQAEPVALDRVPVAIKRAAVDAAAAIGIGLYGVDLKATSRGACVLEVNDNPDIDHDVEAAIDPDRVYGTVIEALARRARQRA